MNLKAIPALCVTLCVGQAVQAQLEYTVNADNTLTITGYTGPPWAVAIPTNIHGLTVVAIGDSAFENSELTSVTIPGSVASIGEGAFTYCYSLTNATIANGVTIVGTEAFIDCNSLARITIPGSVASIGQQAFQGCSGLTNATVADGVTNIGMWAFVSCGGLTSITIPGSVTSIADYAFASCDSLTNVSILSKVISIGDEVFEDCKGLTSVFFAGNAPTLGSDVFGDDNSNPVIYYLPGTSGWSSPFASRQALLWNPSIQTGGTNFGVQSNQFGFKITGTPYIPIAVEACTNLANPLWTRLEALTLTNGSFYFSEPVQTNAACRFYRITSP